MIVTDTIADMLTTIRNGFLLSKEFVCTPSSKLKLNILNASLLSMQRALNKLKLKPAIAYIDGRFAPKGIKIKYKTIIRGDEKITSIAAASIIAKVSRDLFMIKLAKKYPKYNWHKNFGYGTTDHLNGLKKYGVTKHHRKKFKPIHNILICAARETP